ncbi:MAG: CapA family protein [Oscillospiraceae bacterium]|nr:CapA family protein [Oscillospiraceae bacterium]
MKKRLSAVLLASAMLAGCAAPGAEKDSSEPETAVQAVVTEAAATIQPTETTVPAVQQETQPRETVPEKVQQRSYMLTFVGDCTLGSSPGVYYADLGFVKTVGDNYTYPFANVIQWFAEDDFTFVNLEGPLTDVGTPVVKRYNFRGPTSFVNILLENSIEAVTIANNHSMDYGQVGYDSTVAVLQEAGIPYVERDSSTVVTLPDGLTIGIYGAEYSYLDKEDMVAEITQMVQAGVDVIIYAPHWGVEGSYQNNPQEREMAYAAIDAGAHIVCGSHPHVLQPIEEYNGGVIFYSLGNFSFGGNGKPADFDTALVQQQILVDPDGTVRLGQRVIVPCSVSSVPNLNNYQPTPYPEGTREYARVLEKLSGTYEGPNIPH